MDEVKQQFLWRQSLWRFLAIAVSGAAAMLVGTGIFGLIAFVNRERTFEMGVRAALGASPSHAAFGVFGDGLRLAGAGLILGIPGSLAINRFLEGTLFGVTPTDASAFLFSAGFMALLAICACAIPAFAAARVDPAVALRSE